MDSTQKSPRSITKEIRAEKAELRKRIREVLAHMTASFRAEASNRANEMLSEQRPWKEAQSVLLYAPLPEEPDIWRLVSKALEQGKRVFLPRYISDSKTYVICPIADLA